MLFDIDGTLLLSGGAGKRALNRTFEELFGAADAFSEVPVAGRTDALILDEACARARVTATPADRRRFFARYFICLEEEIVHPGPKKGLMPGVEALLARLMPRPATVPALLTGNFARAAQIKLKHFGIWRYFSCGAYGDDAPTRNDLVPIAVSRARAAGIPVASNADAVVVGDTPLDVQCAAAAGARSVAVATGSYAEDQLRAAGADAVLRNLSDPDHFFRIVDR